MISAIYMLGNISIKSDLKPTALHWTRFKETVMKQWS